MTGGLTGSNIYNVRIVRPVFESVIIAVEAEDEGDAVDKALSLTDSISEKDWSGPQRHPAACGGVIHY